MKNSENKTQAGKGDSPRPVTSLNGTKIMTLLIGGVQRKRQRRNE